MAATFKYLGNHSVVGEEPICFKLPGDQMLAFEPNKPVEVKDPRLVAKLRTLCKGVRGLTNWGEVKGGALKEPLIARTTFGLSSEEPKTAKKKVGRARKVSKIIKAAAKPEED